jgi:hypothetical protein
MRKPPEAKYRPCLINGKRIPHTTDMGWRGVRIDHPMLKETIQWDMVAGQEGRLKKTREVFRNLVDNEEWAKALSLLHHKQRFPYLLSIKEEMDATTFYWLFRVILTTNETLRSLRNPLGRFLSKVNLEGIQPLLMTPGELRFFRKLPRELIVWRGTGDLSLGWAWTYLGEVAHWYASGYANENANQQGFLLKGSVQAADVVAAFIEHPKGHGTLIINPEKVHILKVDVVGSLCPYLSPEERWKEIAKSRQEKPKAEAAIPSAIQLTTASTNETRVTASPKAPVIPTPDPSAQLLPENPTKVSVETNAGGMTKVNVEVSIQTNINFATNPCTGSSTEATDPAIPTGNNETEPSKNSTMPGASGGHASPFGGEPWFKSCSELYRRPWPSIAPNSAK